MELKDIQKKYLHCVYWCGGDKRSVADMPANLGADKRTVSKMLTLLADLELLTRLDDAYVLTGKGRECLSPQLEQSMIIALWLKRYRPNAWGLRRESFDATLCLSPETASWAASEGLFRFALFQTGAGAKKELSAFAGARWHTSVNIMRADAKGKSMGQRGIRYAFVVLRKQLYLDLTSQSFRHRAESGGESVKGALSRLWYRKGGEGGEWAEVFPRRNLWSIPVSEMEFSFGEAIFRANVRIKALAGEQCGMAESEADLVCAVKFDEFFLE
jgi:Mn-dependent DtxR family transcriptional regulator